MYTVTKSYATNFGSLLNIRKLHSEIEADATIVTVLYGIKQTGDVVDICFQTTPSAGEFTALDVLISAHDGLPLTQYKFHTSSKLIAASVTVTGDVSFEEMGGAVTSVGAFVTDASKAKGRVVFQAKASGTGSEVKISQNSNQADMSAALSIPDTAGVWENFSFWTNQNPNLLADAFLFMARKNGATSLEIRYASVSLLEDITNG